MEDQTKFEVMTFTESDEDLFCEEVLEFLSRKEAEQTYEGMVRDHKTVALFKDGQEVRFSA